MEWREQLSMELFGKKCTSSIFTSGCYGNILSVKLFGNKKNSMFRVVEWEHLINGIVRKQRTLLCLGVGAMGTFY